MNKLNCPQVQLHSFSAFCRRVTNYSHELHVVKIRVLNIMLMLKDRQSELFSSLVPGEEWPL
jgi:hypothetical protein